MGPEAEKKKTEGWGGGGVNQCETLRDGRASPRDMSQRKTGRGGVFKKKDKSIYFYASALVTLHHIWL